MKSPDWGTPIANPIWFGVTEISLLNPDPQGTPDMEKQMKTPNASGLLPELRNPLPLQHLYKRCYSRC